MKFQVSLVALLSIMVSLTQPAWSMEETPKNSGKKRKTPESCADSPEKREVSAARALNSDRELKKARTTQILDDREDEKKKAERKEVFLCTLGALYFNGIEAAKDKRKLVELLKQAADKGYAEAQFDLALCCAYGTGLVRDDKKAVELLKQAANKGYAPAQYNLGWRSIHGVGVEKEKRKAVELLKQAADKGHASAQELLGKCYGDGTGVVKDESKAKELFSLARQNHLDGYRNGKSANGDDEEAARLFQQAADLGYAPAQYILGECYALGRGVPTNVSQAYELFKQAAGKGHEAAQRKVAQYRFDAKSAYGQGLQYLYEKGPAYEGKAARQFWLAAEKGHAEAQYHLGLCYAEGSGVKKHNTLAAKLLWQAAKQGHAKAQYNLGLCYAEGRGVGKDEKKAASWFLQATKQGHSEAQDHLGELYLHGTGVKKNEMVATKLFKSAAKGHLQEANKGNAGAQYNLGQHYLYGRGVEKDERRAVELFKQAADKGHVEAHKELSENLTVREYLRKESETLAMRAIQEGRFFDAIEHGKKAESYGSESVRVPLVELKEEISLYLKTIERNQLKNRPQNSQVRRDLGFANVNWARKAFNDGKIYDAIGYLREAARKGNKEVSEVYLGSLIGSCCRSLMTQSSIEAQKDTPLIAEFQIRGEEEILAFPITEAPSQLGQTEVSQQTPEPTKKKRRGIAAKGGNGKVIKAFTPQKAEAKNNSVIEIE